MNAVPPTPPTSDERMWGMLAHLLTLVAPILAPLIVLLVHQEKSAFIVRQAKESLNFQITVMIAVIVLLPTICIGIGIVLLPVLGILDLVCVVLASIAVNGGQDYRYPLTLRLVP